MCDDVHREYAGDFRWVPGPWDAIESDRQQLRCEHDGGSFDPKYGMWPGNHAGTGVQCRLKFGIRESAFRPDQQKSRCNGIMHQTQRRRQRWCGMRNPEFACQSCGPATSFSTDVSVCSGDSCMSSLRRHCLHAAITLLRSFSPRDSRGVTSVRSVCSRMSRSHPDFCQLFDHPFQTVGLGGCSDDCDADTFPFATFVGVSSPYRILHADLSATRRLLPPCRIRQTDGEDLRV